MVDSRTEREMEDLRNRVRAVDEKLDRLAASLNTRFDGVDAAFQRVDGAFHSVDAAFHRVDAALQSVDAAFVEQRQYTEFAFAQLQTRMDAGFARLELTLQEFINEQRRINDLVERRLNSGGAGPL
jgi:chromosome segregation ATPase